MLDPGPCLLPCIFDILVRFRLGKIEIVADIKKVFLQIAVDEDERDFLRMIWYKNVFAQNPTVKILQFARVVFDLTSSPFILNETFRIHLQKYLRDEHNKEIIQKLIGELYVDDVTSSLNNEIEGQQFYEIAKSCLTSASFELRKWVTNDDKLQQYFNYKESNGNLTTNNTNRKVLSLTWCTENDTFVFDFKNLVTLAENLKPTKRNMLRISAMFYDPIALIISPIILQLRLIFHIFYPGKYDWDTELPVTLRNKLIKELKVLEGVPVSRHVLCKCGNQNIDVFGFCDSSGEAYAACIYILSQCFHGVTVNLVTSKRELVPSKPQTIPRLELLSSLLLSKLLVSVLDVISQVITASSIFCWSESMVVLWWIKQVEKRCNMWVQNRVNVIRVNSSSHIWFHIRSPSNPVDISTHSISLAHLDLLHWFHGP